jgi:hypothetical protein
VGAIEGVLEPVDFPGTRISRRFCRDLDEVGADEDALEAAAKSGRRVFGGKCCDLELEREEEG